MKKYILFIVLIFCGSSLLRAQNDDGSKRGEKVQALKIAFITQKLELTAEEAQKFWPVYGQYENELKAVLANSSNEDVIDNDERLLNVRKKYRPEFTKLLGQARMNTLFAAEKEFRRILLQRLKSRNNH